MSEHSLSKWVRSLRVTSSSEPGGYVHTPGACQDKAAWRWCLARQEVLGKASAHCQALLALPSNLRGVGDSQDGGTDSYSAVQASRSHAGTSHFSLPTSHFSLPPRTDSAVLGKARRAWQGADPLPSAACLAKRPRRSPTGAFAVPQARQRVSLAMIHRSTDEPKVTHRYDKCWFA